MNLMRLEQASLAFGSAPLLDNVNLQIDSGERICLIGRNGTGKSSLMKVLTGENVLDSGTLWQSPACRIGYLEQELPDREQSTVAQVVASGLAEVQQLRQQHDQLINSDMTDANMDALEKISQKIDELDGWQLENKVERILSRLQLDGSKTLQTLSGGWRRRVSLAKALVAEPSLLLLDEPTNHLDLLAIEWLEQQLLNYQGAIVFITHDRRFLDVLANRIIELDRGYLHAFPGNYTKFLAYREQQLADEATRDALFDKQLAQEEVWVRQGIKARRTRNEGRVRALQQMRLERSQRRQKQSNARMQVSVGQDSGKLVCELTAVGHRFDAHWLFKDIDLTIMKGDRIALIGANGVGKSTLLRIILGDHPPQMGTVKQGSKQQVAYFDQLRDQLDVDKTVLDNLAEGRQSIEINGKSKHIMSYLGDFLFTPQRVRSPVSSLSGGERNRLLLAKLFSKPANILVLDEPTNDLDIETLELLEELLANYQGTVLLVSHDRQFVDQVVTSCLVFDGQGAIEESVGGYSNWHNRGGRLQSVEQTAKQPQPMKLATESTVKTETSETRALVKPKKLSYKLQKELDDLPEKIEGLESQMEQLQQRLSASDFYQQPHDIVTKELQALADLETQLETAMERWVEIESM